MDLVAWAIRVLYRLCCLFPQRDEVVFLSRQAARPLDFALLEPELMRRLPGYRFHWECVSKIGKLNVRLMVRQTWHAARARICFVDGYVPAVSIPRRHRALTIQVWHALGAIKRFGYQSLDTPAGRTSRQARSLRMHRGYDYIIAGLPGAVSTFSEAFDFPAERIAPLGLPRVDYLVDSSFGSLRDKRAARVAEQVSACGCEEADAVPGPVVLYAPTFRKGNGDPEWLEHAIADLCASLSGSSARLVVAGHPLHTPCSCGERDIPVTVLSGVATIDALAMADYVVTDYSTVAFESAYAGKPVLFYVPDVEEYRLSPGLNIDPLRELPSISFADATELTQILTGARAYDATALAALMRGQAQGLAAGAIDRIADFTVSHLTSKGN